MPYATVDQLEGFFGAERLRQWYGHIQPAQLESNYLLSLSAATGEMNQVFQRAGYAVPLDFMLVTDASIRQQLEDMLARWCCALAVYVGLSGNIDAPQGAKTAHDAATAWLDRILNGTESLLGMPKLPAEALTLSAGRIGAVYDSACNSLPPGLFRAWGWTSGSVSFGNADWLRRQ